MSFPLDLISWYGAFYICHYGLPVRGAGGPHGWVQAQQDKHSSDGKRVSLGNYSSLCLLSAQAGVDHERLSNEHPVTLWSEEEDFKEEQNSISIK